MKEVKVNKRCYGALMCAAVIILILMGAFEDDDTDKVYEPKTSSRLNDYIEPEVLDLMAIVAPKLSSPLNT